jgi:outer membrane receptor for ferric coprogen and ferric-rhodotorulic acid
MSLLHVREVELLQLVGVEGGGGAHVYQLALALFYTINRFNLHVNVNNLFDKYYFVGGYDYFRASPGAPRNYMATLGYSF